MEYTLKLSIYGVCMDVSVYIHMYAYVHINIYNLYNLLENIYNAGVYTSKLISNKIVVVTKFLRLYL